MLESDDFACLQTLQENYPDIKVIILTTSDDPKYIFNTIKYGAKGYLLKEISTEELTNAIRRVHQGGAMIHGMIASKMVTMFSRMTQSNHTIQADTRHVTNLKQTEWQIIALLEHGLSNKEIASELNLSEGTVRNSLSDILKKLNLRDRTQLAIWAVQIGTLNRIFKTKE